MLVSPILIRWCCLWSVPDVALPFDPESLLTDELPADEDPDTFYTAIYAKLQERQPEWLTTAISNGSWVEGTWDPRLDEWLVENGDLLNQLEQATSMPPVKPFSRKLRHPLTPMRDCSMLRQMYRLSQSEAMRYQRAGKLDEAWRWRRAGLRLARQTDAPGTAIDYLVAQSMLPAIYELTEQWAADPSLTHEQLQIARDDIRQTASACTRLSDMMKAEYIQTQATADLPYIVDVLYPKWTVRRWIDIEPLEDPCKRALLWTFGEPEISLRFYRQIVVNNLDLLDRPLPLRGKLHRDEQPMIFEDEVVKRVSGKLSSAQLARMLDSPFGQHLAQETWFWMCGDYWKDGVRYGGLDWSYLCHEAHSIMIDLVLAAHMYQRHHGEFPEDLSQLVPYYLPAVPIDPTSKMGAPFQYKRSADNSSLVLCADDDGAERNAEDDHRRRRLRIFLKDNSSVKTETQ